jgi:hypothetical protein
MHLNYNGWLLVACLWFILDRYLDEEMIFGIDGENVHSMTGALIPEVTFILTLLHFEKYNYCVMANRSQCI